MNTAPAPGGPAPRPSWLRALTRLWCLRPVEGEPAGEPVAVIVILSVSWLIVWAWIDRWQRQPDPEFNTGGVPLLAWYALAIVALAGLLRHMCRPRPRVGATMVVILGLVPLPLLLVSVAVYYLDGPWFWCAACAVALYTFFYLMRGLRSVTGRSQRLAASLGVVLIAGFMWVSDAVDAIPDLWNPGDTGDSVADDRLLQGETALFEQADRIDAALDTVHRDASAAPQAFFLGFAGVGEEKVFAQEIGLASRVFAERFGLGDRRLSLINDERDLDAFPLASATGLEYALHGLAAHMHLDTDVLLLSISSHGSQEPRIAVSNLQFPLASLSPDDLAAALKDSGIKWRVIVISACYAGGFIDKLRDPRTIVIAAAAADRTSFGCSNDSDLTYFGEAFYRDALPGAKSLRDAFDAAKVAVAARERSEHITPSNPQAYFGPDIEAKLAAMKAAR